MAQSFYLHEQADEYAERANAQEAGDAHNGTAVWQAGSDDRDAN